MKLLLSIDCIRILIPPLNVNFYALESKLIKIYFILLPSDNIYELHKLTKSILNPFLVI